MLIQHLFAYTDRLPGLRQEEDFHGLVVVSRGKYIGYGIGDIIAKRAINHLAIIIKREYHRYLLRHIQQNQSASILVIYNRNIFEQIRSCRRNDTRLKCLAAFLGANALFFACLDICGIQNWEPSAVGVCGFAVCICADVGFITAYVITHSGLGAVCGAGGIVVDSSKSTPGYAGGKKELIARGEVDKKKAPHYSRSGLPTTQLQ